MSGFKHSQPGLRLSGEAISPDEQDSYTVYQIALPGTTQQWFGSAPISGTADTKAFTVINAIADYPRNMLFVLAATGSQTALKGTAVVNGKDQFGSVISETFAIATGTGAGTVVGTKVFAQFTSGTVSYGTMSTTGTPNLGFVVGTNCLFGLPVKLNSGTAGTADVVMLSHNAGTGAVTVGGGTIAAFVNAPMSAVRPAAAITGTEVITAWVKSSFNPDSIPTVANMKQVV